MWIEEATKTKQEGRNIGRQLAVRELVRYPSSTSRLLQNSPSISLLFTFDHVSSFNPFGILLPGKRTPLPFPPLIAKRVSTSRVSTLPRDRDHQFRLCPGPSSFHRLIELDHSASMRHRIARYRGTQSPILDLEFSLTDSQSR